MLTPLLRAGLVITLCVFGHIAECQPENEEEKIIYYSSRIDVDTSGYLSVTETIKVRAAGINIQHGIYRQIPTRYTGKFGEKVVIPLEILYVTRDGHPEPYFEKDENNGVSIYIGSKHMELPHGEHIYTISYRIGRQIGFFDSHDELYWNVTGSGWRFQIDSVYAVVNLPAGTDVHAAELKAYSGPSGATGCDCKIVPLSESSVGFYTTGQLNPYEGLTIFVPFGKGIIHPPSRAVAWQRLIDANYPAYVLFQGLGIVILYYLAVWLFVGRDPRGRTIVPRFEPPQALTPYEVRFLKNMHYDVKTMVVAIIWMAQKGYLTIEETGRQKYLLTRADNIDAASPIEKQMIDRLFKEGQSIELEDSYDRNFSLAESALVAHLRKSQKNIFFKLNRQWMIPGILLSIAAVAWAMLQFTGSELVLGAFLTLWLSLWTFGCFKLAGTTISYFRDKNYGKGIGMTLFSTFFYAAEVFVALILISILGYYFFALLVAAGAVNAVFYSLMRAPTMKGRQLLDEIEGFASFIDRAELPRMRSLTTTPVMDLALFERYLPYALALNLQTEWTRHFEKILASSEVEGRRLSWYTGLSNNRSLSDLSSSLSSGFASTISSSTTAPGSSSGGSSGSSGGGGGGGGGGGW